MTMTDDPPSGFEPLFRSSPFLDHNGPFFHRTAEDGTFVVGLRIQPKHANARGSAHGGLLMTMCDIALGYRTTRSQTPSPMLTTASVSREMHANLPSSVSMRISQTWVERPTCSDRAVPMTQPLWTARR